MYTETSGLLAFENGGRGHGNTPKYQGSHPEGKIQNTQSALLIAWQLHVPQERKRPR